MVDVLTGKMYYYGNDKLGTPQIMTDSTNTVVWEADYKPFGEADVNPNSSVVNNFRFPGQYYDARDRATLQLPQVLRSEYGEVFDA